MGSRSSSYTHNKQNLKKLDHQEQYLNTHSYKQILPSTEIEFDYVHIVRIGEKSYIILIKFIGIGKLQIYDIESHKIVKCDLTFKDVLKSVFTNKNFLYIQTQRNLYQLHLRDGEFMVIRRYHSQKQLWNTEMLFINDHQDLMLEQYINLIRFKSLKLSKLIFKIKQIDQRNLNYDKKNNMIIYIEKPKLGHQFITIQNLQNRQIMIRQFLFKIIQIVLVQNTNEILIQIHNQGLYLYKINDQDRKIYQIKILHYNVELICIFDHQNLLNILSHNFFIKFDHQYNVVQRFQLQSQKYTNCLEQLLPTLSNVKIQPYLPELLAFRLRTQKPVFIIFQLDQSVYQQENDLCLCECQNYSTEYQSYNGRTQHLISPNQRYLASIIMDHSLLFHNIQERADKCIHFNELIKYISFSYDSNYLYVVLRDQICAYKTDENMKKCVFKLSYINQIQNKSVGLIIAINNKDQAIIINRGTKKQIFKNNAVQDLKSFDYQFKNGIILMSNYQKITLCYIANRKLLIFQISNKQCMLTYSSQNILILTDNGQLQLWRYRGQQLIQRCKIMEEVDIILNGYLDFYCVRKLNKIIVFDERLKQVEQVDYKTYKHDLNTQNDFDVIGQNDTIISRNYIIRLVIYKQKDHYYPINTCTRDTYILYLEQRQQTIK